MAAIVRRKPVQWPPTGAMRARHSLMVLRNTPVTDRLSVRIAGCRRPHPQRPDAEIILSR